MSRASSNLSGVSLTFPTGTKCSFTLAEAKAGLSFPWELTIEEEHSVIPEPQDAGHCATPAEHGLITFGEVSDGFENTWCLCDEGECGEEPKPTTLVPGEYSGTIAWDGVNWTGPSDTETPKGEPFPAGEYIVEVSATGTVGEGPAVRHFRVEAELPITLSAGKAPDRSVTRVVSGRVPPVKAWAGAMHKGLVRDANEDRFLTAPELGLFVVADGMGGAAAGEVAAQHTVDRLRSAWTVGRSDDLTAVLQEANAWVSATGANVPSRRGMGTTVVALATTPDPTKVRIANVGDSRIYRLRAGELKQVTSDHSLVQKLVDLGQITPKEAAVHPKRNIITRAIGTRSTVDVDEETLTVRPGDLYILASDGVHGMLSDLRIRNTVQMHPDLQAAADELIAAANDAGGRDNIAVVLVQF